MRPDDLPPLSDRARALLAAERRRPEPADDLAARVREHVLTSVAAGLATHAAGTGAATAAGASLLRSAARAKIGAALAGAFLLGGGTGVATYRALAPTAAPPSVQVPASEPASARPVVAPPVSATGDAPAPPASATRLAPPTRSAPSEGAEPPARPGGKDTELGRESVLLERARMAMARGDGAGALEALDAHAREFPGGRMTEEREAMAVQALAQVGRVAEAQRRADRFRARFPHSVFLPVIDAVARPPSHDE